MDLEDYTESAWIRSGVWWCLASGALTLGYLVYSFLKLLPLCADAARGMS